MKEKLRNPRAILRFNRRNYAIIGAKGKEREFRNGTEYPTEKIRVLPDSAHEVSTATPEDIKKRLAFQAKRLLQSEDPASIRYRREHIVKITKWLNSA